MFAILEVYGHVVVTSAIRIRIRARSMTKELQIELNRIDQALSVELLDGQ